MHFNITVYLFINKNELCCAITSEVHLTAAAALYRSCCQMHGVGQWSRQLQLNATKTELMWFGSPSSLRSLSQSNRTVVVGNDVLQPVQSVCNLVDSKLSM